MDPKHDWNLLLRRLRSITAEVGLADLAEFAWEQAEAHHATEESEHNYTEQVESTAIAFLLDYLEAAVDIHFGITEEVKAMLRQMAQRELVNEPTLVFVSPDGADTQETELSGTDDTEYPGSVFTAIWATRDALGIPRDRTNNPLAVLPRQRQWTYSWLPHPWESE